MEKASRQHRPSTINSHLTLAVVHTRKTRSFLETESAIVTEEYKKQVKKDLEQGHHSIPEVRGAPRVVLLISRFSADHDSLGKAKANATSRNHSGFEVALEHFKDEQSR